MVNLYTNPSPLTMYTPCYEEPCYIKAKALRLNQQALTTDERELLETINRQFGVTAFYFDFKAEREKVRVDLMLNKTGEGLTVGYTNRKLIDCFRAFLEKHPERFRLKANTDLVIHFESYERVAIEEMLYLFKENELKEMPAKFPVISQIHDGPRSFTIFIKTDQQMAASREDGTCADISDFLHLSMKKYDPFDYCMPDTITFYFDTIENLETNYKGDWMNYYR